MPIFSYRCEKCDHTFDLLEGMTAEKTERKCPECGSTRIKKTHAAFSVGKGGSRSAPAACPTCPAGPSACSTGMCPF
ncbi:MAG: zinc ribbon domain-containing protein [PVC group bacterium]